MTKPLRYRNVKDGTIKFIHTPGNQEHEWVKQRPKIWQQMTEKGEDGREPSRESSTPVQRNRAGPA
jgi:hypothetical protein